MKEMQRMNVRIWLLSLLCVLSPWVQAELVIRITEGAESAIPVAVVPFANPGGIPLDEDVGSVVRNDLAMSGDFKPLDPARMLSLPARGEEVYYRDWRLLGQQYVLIGELTASAGDQYQMRYELFDVNQQKRILGEVVQANRGQLRSAAHYVSDKVYEAITGVRGIFSTRIAYVTVERQGQQSTHRLQISDVDGQRAQVILKSSEPVLSPEWSPDGTRLAYVSFEGKRPAIYIHHIATGRREKITNFSGLNSAPSWSPDGNSLLMTLSKDGNAEIYRMDLQSRQTYRATDHWAIDTEASWMPDGRRFVFTSDRAGGPQLYMGNASGGEPRRLSFEGRYNASPRVSPDGKHVYFVHQRSGQFNIARMTLDSGDIQALTRGREDDSPSVAPNGRLLIYASERGTKTVLSVISANGGEKFYLPANYGDVRDPAWSPFMR